MAGTNGDGQSVQLRALDKHGGLFGIGQHLAVIQFTLGANAIFLARFTSFQVTQATQFTFHCHTHLVRHVYHFAGHFKVVVE